MKVKTLRNFAVAGEHYDAQKIEEFPDDIARQLITMGKCEAVEETAAPKGKAKKPAAADTAADSDDAQT